MDAWHTPAGFRICPEAKGVMNMCESISVDFLQIIRGIVYYIQIN